MSLETPFESFTLPNSSGYGCLMSPNRQIGIPVPLVEYKCRLGFYCPNTDLNKEETLPVICPPTPDCGRTRLLGGVCNVTQGLYEPQVCPAGYYCPDYKQKIKCPAGSFCITGSIEPKPCHALASCPEGTVSQTFYGGILLFALLDVLILISYLILKAKEIKLRNGSITATISSALNVLRFFKPKQKVNVAKSTAEGREDEVVVEDEVLVGEETSVDLLVDAFTRGLQNHKLSIGFKFQDLEFTLKNGIQILSGVTGEIGAGKMTAIMGPSGAGKTTFMNVLMGKVNRSSGKLFVNNVETEMHKFKKIIGFVAQEDILIQELTVRENILHSAKVRLPRSWTLKQKEEYVDNIIEALGLTAVAHNRIGDETSRGISGGQRKRVNIALELAGIPVAIFLDEPTSGLDSTAALQVASILRNLTNLGITIVSVIHQPRIEIFELFTDVLMIAPGGETAYLGPVSEAKAYFQRLGFEVQSISTSFSTIFVDVDADSIQFTESGNPADIMMDILSGKGKNPTRATVTSADLVKEWKNTSPMVDLDPTSADEEFIKIASSLTKERGATTLTQTYLCLMRSFSQQYATISGLYLELFVGTFAGVLMGLAAFNVKELYRGLLIWPYTQLSSTPISYTPALVALLMGITSALASAPSGVKVFGEEKLIFWRESAAGHSRFAYYMGKTLSTLPRIALSALHFSSMFYYLSQPVFGFAVLYGVIFMKFFGVYGLSSVISMVVARANGPLLAVVFSLFAAVFCGYGPTIRQAKSWNILFLWEISFNKWAAEILCKCSKYIRPYDLIYSTDITVGQYGYTINRNGVNFAVGFSIGVLLRVIAFVLLVFMNKSKQR
ncbi:hypothetical protein HK098_001846 [Nowakowskiella sp. JEL0407]|nr:hypothetical protein HK098_001846 [Nowakowskiella sp. JEL0407]